MGKMANHHILIIGVVFFLLLFGCSRQSVSEDESALVAKVGNEKILLSEVEELMGNIPPYAQKNYQGEMGKLRLLNQMIDNKLIIMDAKAQKLDQLAPIQTRLEQIQREMMKQELFNKTIRDAVTFTDEEVQAYYEAHIDDFTQPDRAKTRHILTKTEEDAKAALTRIRNGESFADVAKEMSKDSSTRTRGGLIGYVSRGKEIRSVGQSEEFENVVFNTKAGEVSDQIVETDYGYHLIKVDEHLEKDVKPLDEVREQVESMQKREKIQEERLALIEKLKKKYNVQIFEDQIPDSTNFNQPLENDVVLVKMKSSNDIKMSDLYQMLEGAPPALRARYSPKENVSLLIQQRLEDELLFREAKDQGFEKDSHVQEQLERTLNNLLLETYYEEEIEKKVSFNDEQLQKYYDDHQNEFTTEERVHAYHILCETKEMAEKVLQELKNGADFQETAKKYSKDVRTLEKGGDLGLIERGRFVPSVGKSPEFEDVAFSLQPGQISDIIETTHGFHIVTITEKLEKEVEPLNEETKDRIQRILKPAEARRFQDRRLKELRQEYDVVVYENRLIDPEKKIEWLFNEAQEAQANNRPDEALQNYDEIIGIADNSPHAYKAQFMKGFVYSEFLNDYDRAIKEYKQVLEYEEADLHDDAKFMIEDLERRKKGEGSIDGLILPPNTDE